MDSRWIKYVLFLFIGSLPLSKALDLPYLPLGFQASELLFLFLTIGLLCTEPGALYKMARSIRQFPSLLILILLTLGSMVWRLEFIVLYQGLATVYVIFFCFVLTNVWTSRPGWRISAIQAYVAGSVVLAGSALVGGLMKWYWGPAGELAMTQTLPYLGTIHRLTGWTETPTMLGMSLSPALIYLVLIIRGGKSAYWEWPALLIIGGAWLGSLSKSHLILGAVLLISIGLSRKSLYTRVPFMSGGFLILFTSLFFLHFYPMSSRDQPQSSLVVDRPLFRIGNRTVYPTKYVLSHTASWTLGVQNIWIGVGPGRVPEENRMIKFESPEWRRAGREAPLGTHNLWLGLFATLGLFGMLCMLYISYWILRWAIRNLRWKDPLVRTSVLVLLFWMTEGLVTDVLHFRAGWFFLSFGMASMISD